MRVAGDEQTGPRGLSVSVAAPGGQSPDGMSLLVWTATVVSVVVS